MKNFKAAKIVSSVMAVIAAVTAASGVGISTVCAAELPTQAKPCASAASNLQTIKDRNGKTFLIDMENGSSAPLNFIGANGSHYYIDSKCIAEVKDGKGIIRVLNSEEFKKGKNISRIAGVPLSEIITFTHDGKTDEKGYVSSIGTACTEGHIFKNIITVEGKCPANAPHHRYFNKIEVTDGTGAKHKVGILGTKLEKHEVLYNCDKPEICDISWCTFSL